MEGGGGAGVGGGPGFCFCAPLLHSIYYPRTTLALPPSSKTQIRGEIAGLPTKVLAFIIIARIIHQLFFCRSISVMNISYLLLLLRTISALIM